LWPVAKPSTPLSDTAHCAWISPDPIAKEISAHFAALSSSYDDTLDLFRNYKSAEPLLADRCWCYSLVKPGDEDPIGAHLDRRRQARGHEIVDKARDHAHPGPRDDAPL
jgi:hypothetical protein